MSFLVGCILIWHFNLSLMWILLAAGLYCAELMAHGVFYERLRIQIIELEERLTGNGDQD